MTVENKKHRVHKINGTIERLQKRKFKVIKDQFKFLPLRKISEYDFS